MSAKPSDAAANRDALDEFLDSTRHDEGCSAEHGTEYRCRCHIKERAAEARSQLAAIRAERDEYFDAITWAMGANGVFHANKPGGQPFWWRTELRTRAGIEWDGSKYVRSSPAAAERSGET